MSPRQRQLVLLVGFMTLLASVTLFLFVYAPDPANPPGTGPLLPETVQEGINATVQGWEALFDDISSAQEGLSGD